MKKTRIAINGFGRIGRTFLRAMLDNDKLEIVAINDLTNPKTLAHLFKYDSVHGVYKANVKTEDNFIVIGNIKIPAFSEKKPELLPWKELQVDIVIESTGFFLTRESASGHIKAGAKKVILSAPANDPEIKSVVMGVNEHILDGTEDIISNASCTTNCAAPMIKVLDENFGIQAAHILTIHSYTGDQSLHDSPHKDLRRARAAAMSIIPTSTGAAKAITSIFPHLKGKMGGAGVRVPVPDGSLTDITCTINKPATFDQINEAFNKACIGSLKGIMEYTLDPIVSVDIVGNPHSCVFDPELTSVIGNMIKVVGWYDNEAGYSNRLVDLILKIRD
ncbi:MAG: type I glyceraldehyde-3-phosphate dehydrogenase [Bacteroidetes bacterium]|nr:type I glyceraldehyde-3-phosphate dehydrogenase [Bacteroidota bacterium]HET6245141.1 type I glyceraldehyde-3-phosphate dehydrogenase [Bacteroidia bacterium]